MPTFSFQIISIQFDRDIGQFSKYWYRYCIVLFIKVHIPTTSTV